MPIQNPNGEMRFWYKGAPFSGMQKSTYDAGEMRFWFRGGPFTLLFPAAGGGTAALASLMAFSSRMRLAITGVTALTGKITDASALKAVTTNATTLSGNIKDTSSGKAVTTQVTALASKIVAQCRAFLNNVPPAASYPVGIAAKTSFQSRGRGVIVFITALFATVTMQSTARAIATRAAGLQGLLKFDTRTKITGGSFPVGLAAKATFISKGIGSIVFLVNLFASATMQSAMKGITTRTTSLQGRITASSKLKLSAGTFTVGVVARAAFAASLRAVLQFSGGAVVTLYAAAYIARSPIGMYIARSHIGQFIARGGRAK